MRRMSLVLPPALLSTVADRTRSLLTSDASLRFAVLSRYAGVGMSGVSCVGVTADAQGTADLFIDVMTEIVLRERVLNTRRQQIEWLKEDNRIRNDVMGRQIVWYWPGLCIDGTYIERGTDFDPRAGIDLFCLP